MTDTSDPMENRTHPEISHPSESIADRLLRRKSASGVALPQIRRRLARITQTSDKIRKERLVLPGSAQRERIKNFSATLRQKQVQGPRVGSRTFGNQRRSSWEQLELSLPNGAPAESSRSNVLRTSLGNMGSLSGGQVISPFSPPDSSSEPSFMERRRARIGSQETKKTASASKKPETAPRLFSRVEEIKPSESKQAGSEISKFPMKDQDLPESSGQPKSQTAPRKPGIPSGKSSTVQREVAPNTPPLPHSPHKESQSEPRPVVESRKPAHPDASQEEPRMEPETSTPQQTDSQSAVETHPDFPLKPRSTGPSHTPQPAIKNIPVSPDLAPKDYQQTDSPSHHEPKAFPKSLPEQSREDDIQQERAPSQQPVVTKAIRKTGEDKLPPPASKPSLTSVPPSTIQREPERGGKPSLAPLPETQKPAGTAESHSPLEQPLAPHKSPARQQEDHLAPEEKTDLNPPAEMQLKAAETREPSPSRPSVPEQKPDFPVSPAAPKPVDQPQKSFVEPQPLEKPVVFRPVLARQSDKSKQFIQARKMAVRPAISKPISSPKRIAARSKPDLIHRQVKPASSGSSRPVRPASSRTSRLVRPVSSRSSRQTIPAPKTLQMHGASESQSLVTPPTEKTRAQTAQPLQNHPQDSAPRPVLPIPILIKSPLRLSLRRLTASQARPASKRASLHSQDRAIANKESPGIQTAAVKHPPLLLTQRDPQPRYVSGKTPGHGSTKPLSTRKTGLDLGKPGPKPVSVPSFSSPAVGHLQGEKILITRPGRQLIQRQVQQSAAPGQPHPVGEAPKKPSEAFSGKRTVLQRNNMPGQRSEQAAIPQKPGSKDFKASKRTAKGSAPVIKPAKPEVVNHPVAELPVVQLKKTSPVEQIIQREVAVSGPTAQREVPEPQAIASSQSTDHSDANPDLGKLARDVYPIIKRMIAVEKERSSGRLY